MLQHFDIKINCASNWTERVRKRILQIANYNYCVLVMGPSDTHKERVAQAIHAHGSRQDKASISFNCAAIPSNLFRSQRFAHVKGVFTGAQYSSFQLLRLLQENIVVPVGSHEGQPFDVRVMFPPAEILPQSERNHKLM